MISIMINQLGIYVNTDIPDTDIAPLLVCIRTLPSHDGMYDVVIRL